MVVLGVYKIIVYEVSMLVGSGYEVSICDTARCYSCERDSSGRY